MMISKEELYSMYYDKNMTQKEIGKVFDVSNKEISIQMKMYGIKSRTRSEAQSINSTKPPKPELRRMYHDEKMTQKEIGELYGVDNRTISQWMIKYKIEARVEMISESVLHQMYINEKMTQEEIGEIYGVSGHAVSVWMKLYKIKTRKTEMENNGNWKGGISGGKYCYKFNNIFKEAVRKRDDYTCQLCGYEQLFDERKLDVHHIHYDKENCYPDVVALCRSCNTKVNFSRDYWEEYFENLLIEKGLYCWSFN